MRFFLLIALIISFAFPAIAQIKMGKDVQKAESQYLVTDSAVFEFFIKGQKFPYKIYDFSTRTVYVLGSEDEAPVNIPFQQLGSAEDQYILEIGCDAAQLSNSFKRFCN